MYRSKIARVFSVRLLQQHWLTQLNSFFVRLDHIRKCFTQNGGIFVLEEFNYYADGYQVSATYKKYI
ncbi:hypothetical protein K1T71_015179 [Dendrolimus kikuchii]|nr:hypothetical protein K1T71_015179 [Dendrolimus kikuchii]